MLPQSGLNGADHGEPHWLVSQAAHRVNQFNRSLAQIDLPEKQQLKWSTGRERFRINAAWIVVATCVRTVGKGDNSDLFVWNSGPGHKGRRPGRVNDQNIGNRALASPIIPIAFRRTRGRVSQTPVAFS